MDTWNVLLTALLSFVVSVLTSLLMHLLVGVWQCLSVDEYKMKCLKEAMEQLHARYTDNKVKVRTAELEEEICSEEVKYWLRKVESIQDEVYEIEKIKKDYGGFPSYLRFWERYSLGHEVLHMIKEVTELFDQGVFKDVAIKVPPHMLPELPLIQVICPTGGVDALAVEESFPLLKE